ncbi:probable cationic amino acid transporter [Trichogramma pretiosum]|uniref:probable cationic amino acid transporter n=1 Tax=Trichogramma pretiosum TaxID=7493 RepID=UPI0006C948BF|nr:probable cationic amino acid transporter [Trichogramma pretiosum]XP_014228433.1 probable cationic amino acid transporter [Trichogramma pretiosum]
MKLDLNLDRDKGLELFGKFIRTKNVDSLQGGESQQSKSGSKQKLEKCLTTLDLTSLGVGSCVGTGMYLVAGMVARAVAGPGVVVSFFIAALASIFSGACYAEFGVRVPHTTGSAYMYSYVTVGELIAFIIGWNMILEYLIGTAACACALSACLDALADGAISESIGDTFGTIFGRPPDFVAFVITLLMMTLMAAGARKSLLFNNVLNAVNLSVWVFIMAAGLFYVDSANWSEHKGFLPYGWSGVFTGAATCFYAFIGFDIIATTGEEATNPKRSIPLAIVSSLVIILIAYVTSSMILTLIVPYDEVDQDSALVEMFGQVGAYKCKYIVAVGALAGLTVSMFGSMFPMPRIVYAMASDGLIFRQLSQVWPMTGTPVLATLASGLAAAFAALIVRLEVLVEMMSIGTLLAYTLVSTCVLILRYQPHTTNLMELLPQSLRTPCRSPEPGQQPQQQQQPAASKESRPDQLGFPGAGSSSLGLGIGGGSGAGAKQSSGPRGQQQRVMVRRVRRANSSSPESDDTSYDDDDELGRAIKDDQYLVGERHEGRYYGSMPPGSGFGAGGPGSGTGGCCGSFHWTTLPLVGPAVCYLARKFEAAQYLCPALFPWVDRRPATEETGKHVMKLVGILYLLIFIFDLHIVISMGSAGGFAKFLMFVFFFAIFGVLLLISRQPQNRHSLMFKTPALPFVPAIAVTVNIYLIFKLSILTLVRFTLWMTIGFLVYFYYGIKNSSLEVSQEDAGLEPGAAGGNIELTITKSPRGGKSSSSSSTGAVKKQHHHHHHDSSATTTSTTTTKAEIVTHEPRMGSIGQAIFGTSLSGAGSSTSTTTQQQTQSSTGGSSNPLFVPQDSFPTWDD